MSTTVDTAPLDAEIVLSRAQARALTDEIKTNLERDWELIVRAYTERADHVLGYANWDAYCGTEFNSLYLRVPREKRDGVVLSLRQRGLSTRAIAAATGLSQSTVARGLRESNDSPPGGLTADSPGQTDRVAAALERAALRDCDITDDQKGNSSSQPYPGANVVDLSTRITGLDGKRYKRKSPAKSAKGEPISKQQQVEEDTKAAIQRTAAYLRCFLDGYDTAYSLAKGLCPDRKEILAAMTTTERNLFEKIEKETAWPASRP